MLKPVLPQQRNERDASNGFVYCGWRADIVGI
jgi:hypothetical protein